MNTDVPLTVLALTVAAYWLCVVGMMTRSRLKFRTASGTLPRTTRERVMWSLWVPVILAWVVLPAIAMVSGHWMLALSPLATESTPLAALRSVAAAIAVFSLAATIPCWLGMGRNWSMAVVPAKSTELVTGGMFSISRHPIYTLNVTLMMASFVVVLTIPMFVIAVAHLVLITLKVENEEKYLKSVHGNEYDEYCRQTARFVTLPGTGRRAA